MYYFSKRIIENSHMHGELESFYRKANANLVYKSAMTNSNCNCSVTLRASSRAPDNNNICIYIMLKISHSKKLQSTDLTQRSFYKIKESKTVSQALVPNQTRCQYDQGYRYCNAPHGSIFYSRKVSGCSSHTPIF